MNGGNFDARRRESAKRCVVCNQVSFRELIYCTVCQCSQVAPPGYCSDTCQRKGWEAHEEACKNLSKAKWGTPLLTWDGLFMLRGRKATGWCFEMQILKTPTTGHPQMPAKDYWGRDLLLTFTCLSKTNPMPTLKEGNILKWQNPHLANSTTTCLILDRDLPDLSVTNVWTNSVSGHRRPALGQPRLDVANGVREVPRAHATVERMGEHHRANWHEREEVFRNDHDFSRSFGKSGRAPMQTKDPYMPTYKGPDKNPFYENPKRRERGVQFSATARKTRFGPRSLIDKNSTNHRWDKKERNSSWGNHRTSPVHIQSLEERPKNDRNEFFRPSAGLRGQRLCDNEPAKSSGPRANHNISQPGDNVIDPVFESTQKKYGDSEPNITRREQ